MSEPQANGRNLRHFPTKGENDDAGKLRVQSIYQCCIQVQSHTPLPPPLQIKGLQQQWASSNEERVQSTENNRKGDLFVCMLHYFVIEVQHTRESIVLGHFAT